MSKNTKSNSSAASAAPHTEGTASVQPSIIEAHEGRIWALAVCPGETGFYTGGEDANICFFKVSYSRT